MSEGSKVFASMGISGVNDEPNGCDLQRKMTGFLRHYFADAYGVLHESSARADQQAI
jgi:hypothetical protein